MIKWQKSSASRPKQLLAIAASFLIGAGLLFIPHTAADALHDRSVTLANAQASATTEYTIGFDVHNTGSNTFGSVQIEFCGNTALYVEACIAPTDFDVSHGQLSMQNSDTNFSINSVHTTGNILVLSRSASTAYNGSVHVVMKNVHNPSVRYFYARITTYTSTDGTGAYQDRGSTAMELKSDLLLSTEVPPFITFCTAVRIYGNDCSNTQGDYVDLGTFTPNRASYGVSQMLAATNAVDGYDIRVQGATLASGNDTISPLNVLTPSAPGISQFGINLRQNSDPMVGINPLGPGAGTAVGYYTVPNRYAFRYGDVIASSTSADDFRLYTVSYLVNIATNQPPGVYAGTYTYIATGKF